MKKTCILAVLAFFLGAHAQAVVINSFGDPALAGGNLIDFDDQTPGSSMSSFTIDGVTFSDSTSQMRFTDFTTGGSYGPYDQGTDLSIYYNLAIEFSLPVKAFAILWGAANNDATMRLYDSKDNLINSVLIPHGPPYDPIVGYQHADIAKVEFTLSDWVKVDHLVYVDDDSTPRVPDTGSTLGLLSVALIGLAAIRRKHAA